MLFRSQYYVQQGNYETARKPNLRERASYLAANFEPLVAAGRLKLLQGEGEILPGVSALLSHGHTAFHQMIKISDGLTTVLYCGDVVPTSSHVRLPWLMGYDLHPLTLMDEKKKVLGQAADENWFLYFEHDPYCDMARVDRNKEDFAVRDRWRLNSTV